VRTRTLHHHLRAAEIIAQSLLDAQKAALFVAVKCIHRVV
jgi:hypothetical protein